MDRVNHINLENPEAEKYREKPAKAEREGRSTIQKVAIGVGAVAIVAGLTVAGIMIATGNDGPTTVITSESSGGSIALQDGKNKITSGGTYTFTGSTSNGKIVVDTTEAVKIILSSVTITNSEGAAIKCKEGSNVTIELVGENILTSTDKGNSTDDPAAVISSDGTLEVTGSGIAKLTGNGKGIKADTVLTVSSGVYNITTTDDAIHSNGNVKIADGELTISTGDDAVHADTTLDIAGGTINITKSHEGLEAVTLTISGGNISIVADDDGINAQNSNGSSQPGVTGDGKLVISGGDIYVNASGDGLDSNGSIEISGGTIYVDGPTSSGDGAIDCDGEIKITGGTLIAVGSAGMAQNATSATQPSVLMNLSGSYSGALTFGGISYTPKKNYQSVLVSSSSLKTGETYELVIGGQTVKSVTVSDNIAGDASQGFGGMGGRGMMDQGGQAPGGQGQQQGQGGQMQGGRGMMR